MFSKTAFVQTLGLAAALFVAATGASAQTASKVGIINVQSAILATKDGQVAAKQLEDKIAPRRKDIERRQAEVQGLQNQLNASSNTASEEVKNKLIRDIDTKRKSLQRDVEDAQAEFDGEQQRLLGEIGQKLMESLNKYAVDNGYTLIIDVSAQSSPVLFAAASADITRDVVAAYDKAAAAAPAPSPAKPAAVPSPAAPAAAKKPAGVK